MNLTKRRWIILASSCLINLCIGSLYAWSVFAIPMGKYLSELSNGETISIAIVFTVANSVGPITMISGSIIQSHIKVKNTIFIGGILFGLGMFFSGFAKSITTLLISYGLGVGLGVGMVYGCTISNSIKFFPDKKGLIGGIVTASYGLSSVIIPIIAQKLIEYYHVTTAFKILGMSMLIIICICSFFVDTCPSGFQPDGWVPPKTMNNTQNNLKWNEMLKTPIFYIMLITLCCGAFSGLMITSQASQIAQLMIGMSAFEASVVVSVLALFNTSGRIIAGYIYDKIGAVYTLISIFVLSIMAMFLLYISNSNRTIPFIIGILIAGLCFGSIMGVFPGFTASQFGPRYHNVNYGIMFIGFATAGYLGPTIITKLYQTTQTYQIAFIIATILSLIGILFVFVYNKMINTNNKYIE